MSPDESMLEWFFFYVQKLIDRFHFRNDDYGFRSCSGE